MTSSRPTLRHLTFATAFLGLAAAVSLGLGREPARNVSPADPAAADPAVARARETVRMLDDLYKTAIVIVTDKYVVSDETPAAAVGFKPLFSAMKKKGWHDVRLIDATDDPIEAGNAPREGFEQTAIARLLAGEAYVDEVVERDGKRVLLAATAVPVVMDKCVSCHAHYAKVKPGQAIGALSYAVPIR